jgi:serine/threonine-protein phosphatase PP1 catalytic subunit
VAPIKLAVPGAPGHCTFRPSPSRIESSRVFTCDQERKMSKVADLIERLKANKDGLKKEEVLYLIDEASKLFLEEPSLLEAEPPLTICGDTHGQFSDVLRIFTTYGWPSNGENRYLFLGKYAFSLSFKKFGVFFSGDYVDRGKQSIETMCLMFALKGEYCFILMSFN